MFFLKQKKGDSSVGTAIAVIISVVLGGLILAGFIYLIDNNVSPGMVNVFNNQQINISRVVPEENVSSGENNSDVLQLGDVNEDGYIDELDVTYLERYLAGWTGYDKPEYGDINSDGIININDLNLLKSQIEE